MRYLRILDFLRAYWRSFVIILAPILMCPLLLENEDQQTGESLRCGYLILLMCVYWLTEALPLPVTSMMPMIALPLLGVMSTKDVAVNYLNSTNYMFLGGLIMAIAVEHCGLHTRVALKIIMLVGTSQARLMLGFMLTTMFISMWISNTATTAMMLPIVDAVAEAINQKVEDPPTEKETVEEDTKLLDEQPKEKANDTKCLTFTLGEDADVESHMPSMVDESLFEKKLIQLTSGKINSIAQLQTLSTLDVTSGHFDDDIENLSKMGTPEHVLTKVASADNVQRRNTMSNLMAKQIVQKRMRHASKTGSDPKPVNPKQILSEEIQGKEIEELGKSNSREETERNFLLMGIAMAANIGGTGVVTGTPPNLVVPDILQKKFGPSTGLTFASWMAFAIPVMIINALFAWMLLQRLQRTYPGCKSSKGSAEQESRAIEAINKKYSDLGKMSVHEIQVMVLFIILIFLWFFKTPIFMPGWGDLFKVTTSSGSTISVASATPAIFTCVMLFVLPQNYKFWPFAETPVHYENSPSLITWRLIETKMCWGVIFLLGGGFALARALQESGLSSLMVVQLTKLNLNSLPVWLASFIFCFVTVFITNIASNTATANVFVPILAEMAVTMCINPIYLTLPAGIACSYAFGLPVSTAPNAIIFGHSTLKTTDMLKAGMLMNLISVTVLSFAINTYGVLLFSLQEFPDWAASKLEDPTACYLNVTEVALQ